MINNSSATVAAPTSYLTSISSAFSALPTGTWLVSNYTPARRVPTCPTSDQFWKIEPSSPPPTLGLNFATISPFTTATSSAVAEGSQSPISGGAIAGIVIGAIAAITIAFVVFFFRRRRKTKQSSRSIMSGPHANEKPEMYAGPIDHGKAGPVKPKHELPVGAVANPPHAHNTTVIGEGAKTRGIQENVLELGTAPNAYELSSAHIHEASTLEPKVDVSQPRSPGQESSTAPSLPLPISGSSQTPESSVDASESTALFHESELAEEADLAVQELGLVSAQKRRLASQARAMNIEPADVEGPRGEKWGDLLIREQRLRAQLEEIERLRSQQRR